MLLAHSDTASRLWRQIREGELNVNFFLIKTKLEKNVMF